MPLLLTSLCLIVILVVSYALCHGRQRKTASRNPPPGTTEFAPEKAKERPSLARTQNSGKEKAVVLETYPALKSIHHVPVKDGLFPVSHFMVDEEVRKTLEAKASALPNAPAASLKLLDLLQAPESNPREITSLVSTNPVFSAKLLQVINSAYFKQFESVTSIGRAITLLGYNNVRALVLEDILHSALPVFKNNDHELYMKIWTHSAAVAACAGHLGKALFQLSEYVLGTIGILHDIGKYFFHTIERRNNPARDLPGNLPGVIREEKLYGMNHAFVGTIIAKKWQLPDIVTETIEYHHAPSFLPPEGIPIKVARHSFIICLSDLVCKALGYAGDDKELPALKNEYYEKFGLGGDLSDLVTPALIRDIEKAHHTVLSYASAAALK